MSELEKKRAGKEKDGKEDQELEGQSIWRNVDFQVEYLFTFYK